MDKIKMRGGSMIKDVDITFCTYFSHIDVFKFEVETYNTYTAFCLYSGCFEYRIDDGAKRILNSGEMVICPPGMAFYRRIIESAELLMIKFRMISGDVPSSEPIVMHDAERYRRNLENLRECLFCRDMKNEPIYSHYCKDIIYMSNPMQSANDALSHATSIMCSRFSEELSIEDLAREAGYTTVHFINLFKKRYGCTPGRYIGGLRLRCACSLLVRTTKTEKEIAFECGFRDGLYFIRFFKKNTGMTPGEYRRIYSGDAI